MQEIEREPRPASLVEMLRRTALQKPHATAFTFLVDGETKSISVTYAELDQRASAIGAALQDMGAQGQPVLLAYPPGLDYIAAFFGCLYAGAIGVPVHPLDASQRNQASERLNAIAADAGALMGLTAASGLAAAPRHLNSGRDSLTWRTLDHLSAISVGQWREPSVQSDTVAFLQYTSGSTRAPRGVVHGHANVLHQLDIRNAYLGTTPDDVRVCWVPPYHDMGLIGTILWTINVGARSVLMSPVSFLGRPLRWLEAISMFGGTVSGAPSFAYELCVQKVTRRQLESLDLSRWKVAICAGEAVHHETVEKFVRTFESCGFKHESLCPAYGLAEATLLVAGTDPESGAKFKTVQRRALNEGRVAPCSESEEASVTLVSCGRAVGDWRIIVVDPQSRRPVEPGNVGEIWISGGSVGRGYWGRPAETKRVFQARLAGIGDDRFLRTGDLGFVEEGELFITGRLKDVIVIRGHNHYPQDIEWSVERSHRALRPGCGAAFSINIGGEERLVVVQEIREQRQEYAQSAIGSIRKAVARDHGLNVEAIVLVNPKTISKTSSGKVERQTCRKRFLQGQLNVVAKSTYGSMKSRPFPDSR